MKSAIFLAVFFVITSSAHAGGESSDIVGKWTWTRVENACTEVYDYRPDGKLYVQSGTEKTDNTYLMDSSPDQNGFFRMVLKIEKDHGGKDCAGSDEDSTGQESTVYVLFHSSKAIHAVCRDSSLEACYGPLHRMKKE